MILKHINFSDLKDAVHTLLDDPQAGPATRRILLGFEEEALEDSRSSARAEAEAIRYGAHQAREKAFMRALKMKGMESIQLWGELVGKYLPRTQALIRKGTVVDGPALAWYALKDAVESSIYDWDGGDARVQEDEDENDGFHDEADNLMLQIFRIQKEHDPKWSQENDPREEIKQWQQTAQTIKGPCDYRYQRTLKYLDTGELPEGYSEEGDRQEAEAADLNDLNGDEGGDASSSSTSTSDYNW